MKEIHGLAHTIDATLSVAYGIRLTRGSPRLYKLRFIDNHFISALGSATFITNLFYSSWQVRLDRTDRLTHWPIDSLCMLTNLIGAILNWKDTCESKHAFSCKLN